MKKFFTDLLSQLKRFYIIIVALLALGGLFSYYLIVVVENNEQAMKERSFRGLSNISESFKGKARDYSDRNSKNFLNELHCAVNDSELVKKAYSLRAYRFSRITGELTPEDSLKKFFIHFDGEWRTYFRPYHDSLPAGHSFDLAFSSVAGFIQPLLRYDLFSKYVLLDSNHIIFSDTSLSLHSIPFTDLQPIDTLQRIHSGIVQDIETGGTRYKLFLIPFTIDEGKVLILGGLMLDELYYREKMYISDNVLLVLIFLLFVVFVSLPFLKALIMNKEERLNSGDVIFSFMSFTVLASIIVMVAWDLYSYNAVDRQSTDTQLKELARLIGSNIQHEVDAALKQLDVADTVLQKNSKILDSKFRENELCDRLSRDTVMKEHNFLYPFFSHIVWADSAGRQVVRWTTEDYIPTKINITDRPYFINVKKDRLWVRDGQEYFLETINSWVRSEALAIVSKKSGAYLDSRRIGKLSNQCGINTSGRKGRQMMMIALSAPFKSVFDPPLPDGFGYCVIDRNGKVMFHYNKNRILNENFLEETDRNYILTGALNARTAEFFETNYYGRPQRFYVTPLAHTPYYIITFQELKSLKSANTEVVAVSTILLLIHFFFVAFIFLLIQVSRFRAGKLKSIKLRLTWLMPTEMNKVGYLKAIACFVDSFIVLLIFCKFSDPLYTLALIFSNSMLMVLFAYIFLGVHGMLRHDERQQEHSKPPVAGEGNIKEVPHRLSLFRRASGIFSRVSSQKRSSLWIPVMVVLLIYFIMVIVFASHLPTNSEWYLLSQLIIWLMFGLIDRYRYKFESSAKWLSFRVRYVMMQFLLIIIIAVVPSAVFFRITYNQENKLEWKYRILDFAQQVASKEKSSSSCMGKNSSGFSYTQSYFMPFGSDSLKTGLLPEATPSHPFDEIYDNLRPIFAENTGRIKSMRGNESGDSLYRWNFDTENNIVQLYYQDFRKKRILNDTNYLKLSATIAPITLPDAFAGGSAWLPSFLYWSGMVVFLLVFYFFMDFFIRKVFFLRVLDTRSMAGIDEQLLGNKEHEAHLHVVGLPQSGKASTVKKYYKDAVHDINEFDFADILQVEEPPVENGNDGAVTKKSQVQEFSDYYHDHPSKDHPKVLLLHHFEYQQYDAAISLKKLEFLEAWVFKPFLRIILLSSTQSLAFLEKTPNASGAASEEEKAKERNLAYRWLNVMNHFYQLYHPLQGYRFTTENLTTQLYQKTDDRQSSHERFLQILHDIIERECSHGEFLEGIKKELLAYTDQAKAQAKIEAAGTSTGDMPESLKTMLNFALDDDELILKVQSLSQNYYQSLWDALSTAERKLVYDMAQDGLVNHQNIDIINLLINKGLFIVEGGVPRMMNRSFRNFVLTRLLEEDIHEIEEGITEKGTWQRLRPAILVTLVIIAGFILITQRETFNSMLGYLTAFAGGILALIKLFDSLAPKSGSS